ncbi:arylsulfatase A-like enzyme [Flavobacteriaceae bacterium MAR_2009_75]|nr:arylsulfatase A-like enzyme [Flavobacteriaceae bacterium MAR_2009_75]
MKNISYKCKSLFLLLLFFPFPTFSQKNVIILFPEDMGNHLESLGTPGIKTPVLDALAETGVQFTSNFCAQPVCSPSKGALLTGRMPHDNGMTSNVHNYSVNKLPIATGEDPNDYGLTAIKDDIPTLVEILRREGYFTAVTSKTHVQPMDKFRYDFGWGEISENKTHRAETWNGLIDTIKTKADGKPFFLMANTDLTHAPWQKKLVDNNISSDPESRLAPPTSVDWKEIPIHPFLPDTEVARKDLARYFATVQLVDSWAGVLLKDLEESGLMENTLVIFTPDHGMAYQRGKVACYPAGTQVPLIMKGPRVKKGVKISSPVSHIDLMSTILEFLEVDSPVIQHGRSLWPLLRGENTEFADRKTVMTETNSYYKGRAVSDGAWYYIRNFSQPKTKGFEGDPWTNPPMNIDLWMPDHKVYDNQVFSETIRTKNNQPLAFELLAQIVEGKLPEEELYNLKNDPWAVNNLAENDEYKEVLKEMQSELLKWQKKTSDPIIKE